MKSFDYTLEPGRKLERINYEKGEPIVAVIMPFYNDKVYIEQSVNCVLNQTFPLFELIIIDDGSKEEESVKVLDEIGNIDERIRIFHKENEGLSATRDFGVKQVSDSVKYLFFLDSDDLIEKTYLETAYWTLETNKEASWAYTDTVGFEGNEYTWNKWFEWQRMKKVNDLTATSMIRKKDFLAVNGYELREKAVNEDWNFWLKLIAKGKFPVRMNYYGMWYRRKKQGELVKAKQNKERVLEIIGTTAKLIKKPVEAIQYPKQDYDWDGIIESVNSVVLPRKVQDHKITILMLVPWMITGGADKFNLDLIKGLDKEKFEVILVSTEPNINVLRQEFEQYASVYDLTTFLDRKYWACFIDYLIKVRDVSVIFNTNCKIGYAMLPYLKGKYPDIPIIDYVHMEEWYNRNGGFSRDSSAVASVIDKTFVCNQNSEQILKGHFKRKKEEVETVYIGVDPEQFNPEKMPKEKLLKKYGVPLENKYIISYICRIAEQKRPYLLLRIVEKLKQERQDFLFVIAGDGGMFKEIKAEAKKKKLLDVIVFLGNTKNTKEIYAISDLTINCSLKEGLALTSYESLSMGVPVISSDVGGQKELINEKVGIIVPCLQEETQIRDFDYSEQEINQYVVGINTIIKKIEEYQKNCRDRILEGFTIDQMIQKMTTRIEEIANHPNQEKVQNGKNLFSSLDVAKELINSNIMINVAEYKWLCFEYNSNYYNNFARNSVLKEKLWTIPIWRKFIHFLQKTGLMHNIKKVFKKK